MGLFEIYGPMRVCISLLVGLMFPCCVSCIWWVKLKPISISEHSQDSQNTLRTSFAFNLAFSNKQHLKTHILKAQILSVVTLPRNTHHHSAHSSLFSIFIPLSHLNQPSAVMWSVQSCELVIMAIFTQQHYTVFIALTGLQMWKKQQQQQQQKKTPKSHGLEEEWRLLPND